MAEGEAATAATAVVWGAREAWVEGAEWKGETVVGQVATAATADEAWSSTAVRAV